MRGAHTDGATIGLEVVNTVGDGRAECLGAEVMVLYPHSLLAPATARILEAPTYVSASRRRGRVLGIGQSCQNFRSPSDPPNPEKIGSRAPPDPHFYPLVFLKTPNKMCVIERGQGVGVDRRSWETVGGRIL